MSEPTKLYLATAGEYDEQKRWIIQAETEGEALQKVKLMLQERYPAWYAAENTPDTAYELYFVPPGIAEV